MKLTRILLALVLLAAPLLAEQKLDEAVQKAEEQYLKGKVEEALKTLQKVVSQLPTNPEAHLALGRMQERTGAIEDAAASFAKAVEVGGAASPAVRSDALTSLASLDLRRGSSRDAVAHATQAVEAQATPTALAALARAQARSGDAWTGIQTSERAIAAGPTNAAAQEAKGEALLALRRADDAAAAFRKAIDLDQKLVRARVGLTLALVAQGRAAEGVTTARQATELDPKSAEAFAALGWALVSVNQSNWGEAIAQAQQGAFLNPRSALVQYIVGRIFEANASLDQAANSYRKAVEADPAFVPAQLALIQAQAWKDPDGALAAARKLAADAPHHAEAQLAPGRLLLRKGDFSGAAEFLAKTVALAPQIAEAQAFLGTAHQYMGKTPEAVAAYKKAVELAPDNVDYKTTYGLLLGLTGDYEAGAALLRGVVATPGYRKVDGFMNLGWVNRKMKPPKTEESVAAYRTALEIDPKNEQAALGMAWAYFDASRWDEAMAAFRKVMEIKPEAAGEAQHGIAWCLFKKENLKEAKATLEKAAAAGRNDPRLKEIIEHIEKRMAAGEAAKMRTEIAKAQQEECDLGALVRDLGNNNENVKKKAAGELKGCGAQAATYLGYTLLKEPSLAVRRAALTSLQALGPAARGALQQLRDAAAMQPIVNIRPTKDEMLREMEEADLKRDIKALYEKLK
jgi:superkiller protein 3